MKPETMVAYVWACGEIGFMTVGNGGIPNGTLFLARGDRAALVQVITGLARRAQDGETLLVPGVPEAPGDGDAYHAFRIFFERVQTALGRDSNVPSVRERALTKAAVTTQ